MFVIFCHLSEYNKTVYYCKKYNIYNYNIERMCCRNTSTAGGWGPVKGVLLLLRGAALLAMRTPPFHHIPLLSYSLPLRPQGGPMLPWHCSGGGWSVVGMEVSIVVWQWH